MPSSPAGEAGGIGKILIVGGGVAGWMAAAYFNRLLGRVNGCEVTVLESLAPDLADVMPCAPLYQFARAMRLDEAQFMRQTNATYHLANRFNGWVRDGHAFWQPAGGDGPSIDGLDLFHFWLKAVKGGFDKGPLSRYSLQVALCELGKGPRPLEGSSPLMESGAFAYHLDAAALTEFLRTLALGEGVEQVFDEVAGADLDGAGRIAQVHTVHGRTLSASLYLDATGGLMEQCLGDPWIDWAQPVDQAVFLRLPRNETQPCHTGITGEAAGWGWAMPFSHRQQWGYAYSGRHVSFEQAADELLARAAREMTLKGRSAEVMHRSFRPGCRTEFWKSNCVALGAAAGWVEPLAAPLLFFVQRGLGLLLELFPDGAFSPALSRAYNRRMAEAYDAARDFTLAHYALSERSEPFWQEARDGAAWSGPLREGLELYLENGELEPELTRVFPANAWYALLAGGECLPRRVATRAELSNFEKARPLFGQILARHEALARSLPSHVELMEWVHRPPL